MARDGHWWKQAEIGFMIKKRNLWVIIKIKSAGYTCFLSKLIAHLYGIDTIRDNKTDIFFDKSLTEEKYQIKLQALRIWPDAKIEILILISGYMYIGYINNQISYNSTSFLIACSWKFSLFINS